MACTIAEMERLGKYLSHLYVPAIVALVGLSCFGLGRLSVAAGEAPRLVINAPGVQLAASAAVVQASQGGKSGAYVASKSGSKYYLPSCSGASRINEANKVWFATVEEAEAAGYTPAANCPGL